VAISPYLKWCNLTTLERMLITGACQNGGIRGIINISASMVLLWWLDSSVFQFPHFGKHRTVISFI